MGLAARLIKRSSDKSSNGVAMFENTNRTATKSVYDERIGAVVEDEIQPGVVWEQRVKDVEAERERRVVTSPGFSFSAAGLLFPYHLGVAKFLIENSYIKVIVNFFFSPFVPNVFEILGCCFLCVSVEVFCCN